MDADLELRRYQSAEYSAWREVVDLLRAHGAGDINRGGEHEKLHDAIVRWGEELAQLRLHDPNAEHAERALAERRALSPGKVEIAGPNGVALAETLSDAVLGQVDSVPESTWRSRAATVRILADQLVERAGEWESMES